MTERSLEDLAASAADGDSVALNELLSRVQHPIYRHALRFLGHPSDAEDATQEILLRITTRLSTFEGRSKFTTWTYTVATRMLIRTQKHAAEIPVASSDRFAGFIDQGLTEEDYPADAAEYREMCEEVRVACTYGMLLCLSRPLRAAYLLADVLGITDTDGAEILEISPAAYRQRVARSRQTIRKIIDGRCGLVDPSNPCNCGRQINASLAAGILTPGKLDVAGRPRVVDTEEFEKVADQLEEIVAIGDLYRSDRFAAPATVWDSLVKTMPELIVGGGA